MKTHRMLALSLTAVFGLAFISATDLLAEQKQSATFKVSAENSNYVQQRIIDVGNVPIHQVQVFKLHRAFPDNAPVVSGLKIKETRFADYIDCNGTAINYVVFIMENGDKIFTGGPFIVQSAVGGKLTVTGIATITGGTGKLTSIRGILRAVTAADPEGGFNRGQVEMEYWMDK